ncbi:MAG: insulinase family protein, partial [Cyanobacteria bacterium]|nr:insulinase family protein [Cyanobacteriota bacterium]
QRFGLSYLTTQLLNQGNGDLNTTQLAEKFADIGAQYGADTSRDMIKIQLKTVTTAQALQEAIATLALIINKPEFPQESFNQEKKQQLIAITQIQESPSDVANDVFFKKLYRNHPYAHPVTGTLETVNLLRNNQVRDFYKQYLVGSNAFVVLVGDINSEKAHDIAEQLMGHLPKGQTAPPIPKAPALQAAETITINYPSSQTVLQLGQIGITHQVENYFPLVVGNYILGNGSLVSRLSNEVREKRGLTYGISSDFIPMPGEGPFLISFSTQNDRAQTALKITQKTLAAFVTDGPTEEELIAAQKYLVGSFPLSLSSNSNIANALLRMAFYHLPDNYLESYTAQIESVTLPEIKKSFEELIQPDKMLLVTVGAPNKS